MKKIFALVFFTFHLSLFVCNAQTATITDASVQGKTIVVSYDITGTQQGQTFDVELWYSANAEGFKKCSSLNSSEGLTELTAGYDKKITWNVLHDLSRLEANTLDFEVRAAIKAKNTFAINADFTVEGITMRGIQGGTFTMGSNDGEDDEKPAHQVTVSNFAMMKTELTVAQFKVFIDETGYQTDADKRTGGYGSFCWNGSDWERKDGVNWKCGITGSLRPPNEYNHPVIHVSWNDAVAYAEWFSRKTGENWRLPTEAEWEYAALSCSSTKLVGTTVDGYGHAGNNAAELAKQNSIKQNTTMFDLNGTLYDIPNELIEGFLDKYPDAKAISENSCEDNDLNVDDFAWYSENSSMKTHPVGQKTPNGFGLYDTRGNVWEWCNDWYGDYQTGSQTNPKGPSTGSWRVDRGGSWSIPAQYCRMALRHRNKPESRSNVGGFRLVSPK